jgi:iron complex outermembrane receptor protein
MKSEYGRILYRVTTAAAALLLPPAAALAQSSAAAGGTGTATSTDSGIADIVVTATRSNASLQDVPLAVSAFSNRQIEEAALVNVFSLPRIAPSLQVMSRFAPGNAVYALRGQFQNDTGPTLDPSVGVYFDDVYIARSQGGLTNFVDLERIEVLKGPQGTLFGKNTPGGALRLISKKPVDRFEGYGKLAYESFDRIVAEGVINVPLAKGVALRAVGQYNNKRDGYTTNVLTGKPIDHEKTITGRASLSLEPSPDFQILLQGDYTRIRSGGIPTFLTGFFPEAGPGAAAAALEAAAELGRPGDIAFGTAYLQDLARRYSADPLHLEKDMRSVTASSATRNPDGSVTLNGGQLDPFARVDIWGGSGTLEYALSDDVSLKSITAYRHLKQESAADFDGVPINLIKFHDSNKGYQLSQEIVLHGKALDAKLDWTAGGLYFRDKSVYNNRTTVLLSLAAAPNNQLSAYPQPQGLNTSYGLFAQGTYKFTDALSFTAGLRYTIDRRRADVTTENIALDGSRSCGFTVANGIALLPSFEPPCLLKRKATFKEWAYTASLNYEFDADKMAYLRTSRGFRAGGFSGLVTDIINTNSFEPEIVTDYEIGLKADWFSRMFRTNLAVFYSTTSKPQQAIGLVIDGKSVNVNINVGKREVYGVEAELVFRPNRFVSFDSSIAYTDAKLKNPNYPGLDFLTSIPKWTFNVGVNGDADLSPEFALRARADLSYHGNAYDNNAILAPTTAPDAPIDVVAFAKYPSYALLGLRVSIEHKPTGIEAALYGTNLTDKLYYSRFTPVGGLGYTFASLAEPRVLGVSLKVPFGAR